MDGFTLVLLICWLFLLGATIAMWFMDRAVQEWEAKRIETAPPEAPSKRR